MKRILALLLAVGFVFSFAACNNKGEEEAPTALESIEETGGDSIVLCYGTNHYEEYMDTFYLPEGAYFDEDDYATYEEDGYMYSFSIYDDEKEYSAYAVDYRSKEVYTNEPVGYEVAQQLYFDGELSEKTASEYTNCSQNVTNLGFRWKDKDVILVETSYTSESGFDYKDVFVGVEYEIQYWKINENGETEENLTATGLVGFELSSDGWGELTEDQCAWIAGGLFGVDSGREWTAEE